MCVIEVCLGGEAPGGALRACMATGRRAKGPQARLDDVRHRGLLGRQGAWGERCARAWRRGAAR